MADTTPIYLDEFKAMHLADRPQRMLMRKPATS